MATVSELQDLLRLKLGDPGIEPFLLNFFMDEGRRLIEQEANVYWMVGIKTGSLTASTQSYSLTSSSGTGFALTNYKSHRNLWVRETAGTEWFECPIGSWSAAMEEYPISGANDRPRIAVVENATLYLFPTPDDAYPYTFNHWLWTSNSSTITDTDESLTRWPMLLLWASCIAARRFYEHSPAAGQEYMDVFVDEMKKVKKFTNERLATPIHTPNLREAAQVLQAGTQQ